LWDWRGGGGGTFGKGTLNSSAILDNGYFHFIPTGPRINIDGLKADSPDATKKYENTQNDEKEMSGG
jgi:hypothetical protein